MSDIFHLNETSVTIVAVVIFFVILVGYTVTNLSETEVIDKTVTDKQNTITATHLIEDCLKNDKKFVEKEFLDSSLNSNFCDLCQICNLDVTAMVVNLKTNDEWNFGYSGNDDNLHSIFTSIKVDNEVHLGKLYVET